MNIGQQILFFISSLGAFNGMVISLYLFFSKRKKTLSTLFLCILLLALSLRIIKAVFLYFNPSLPKIYAQLGLSACFLIGPSLYYFFRAALHNVTALPPSWKWVWGGLLGALLLTGILLPYQTYPDLWNGPVISIIYYQWIIYLVATGFALKNLLKTFFIHPAALTETEKFWLFLYGSNCVICAIFMLSWAGIACHLYISGPVSLSVLFYLTIFYHFRGKKSDPTHLPVKTEKKKIADTDAVTWIEKLEKTLHDKKLYQDPNIKLSDVAKEVKITPHQLSQLLNDNLGKSFSTYINEYRIQEACKLITTHTHLTFEAIGYEVGYNSKSTFYAAFRKVKDTTPALYKKSFDNQ
ncbi:helix-turn-helix domain-containing protein [Chitinophaga varians]|uniref:helix-turn-helix domain-containing protein n=1 Tax=Chitinophaga varians TaxID=2202339 RepID=UPI00165ED7EE|nr:helix-turn-helix domain-containing protein [Chitinophaga varians]MBC9909161.1 AraC family transcriptional regulator [Chitinophaga varians]